MVGRLLSFWDGWMAYFQGRTVRSREGIPLCHAFFCKPNYQGGLRFHVFCTGRNRSMAGASMKSGSGKALIHVMELLEAKNRSVKKRCVYFGGGFILFKFPPRSLGEDSHIIDLICFLVGLKSPKVGICFGPPNLKGILESMGAIGLWLVNWCVILSMEEILHHQGCINPENNRIFTISTGAGFQPSTVV